MISRSVSSICSFLVLATVLGANLSQSVQSTEEIAQVTSPPRPARVSESRDGFTQLSHAGLTRVESARALVSPGRSGRH